MFNFGVSATIRVLEPENLWRLPERYIPKTTTTPRQNHGECGRYTSNLNTFSFPMPSLVLINRFGWEKYEQSLLDGPYGGFRLTHIVLINRFGWKKSHEPGLLGLDSRRYTMFQRR
jgi:hypothetical protein